MINASFRFIVFTSLLFFGLVAGSSAQEKKYQVACGAFYNLENLFDTIDSPDTDDKEFTPSGPNQWDSKKYTAKLNQLASVIGQIGNELSKTGPVFVGISEVENRSVVEDLVKTSPLSDRGYALVHYESPDRRGIDVAFLYQQRHFKVLDSKAIFFSIPDKPDFRSRDVLLVHGLLYDEPFYIMVCHWPSRSSGEKVTAPLRAAAADLCRKTADSIFGIDKNANIIIMGDLNDDPVDESLMKHLKAKPKPENTSPGDLYNPMWQLYKNGIGSLAYKDAWNLFDQMVISAALVNKEAKGFKFYQAHVFNQKFLIQKDGQYAGYPFRTFGGGVYQGGYSDHLPVYLYLVKEKK